MKFLPTYSTYPPKLDRPCDRPKSSRGNVKTGFVMVIATSWAGENPFKGGYSGLGEIAEINHHEVGRDGLGLALSQCHVRSGRYC